MRTFDIIVWFLFISALVFLYFFFSKRMKEQKAARKKAQKEFEEKKQRYSYLKPGVFDEMPREDVSASVIFHCSRKENEDFDHYFEKFNESEKIIYGIYQLTLTLSGKNTSLHSFFLSPSTQMYVPIIDEIFEKVGAHDIAELIAAARKFAEIIENDEEDEDMGDYSKYNFSDFTNEFITLVNSTNLNEKISNYILQHKEDFYDYDMPENCLENGDDAHEEVSD